MTSRFRRFTKKVLVIANTIIILVFLLACLAPYVDPTNWWFISFAGLAFPFLLLAVLLFFIFWIFFKAKYAVISAIALFAGIRNMSLLFALHAQPSDNDSKKKDELRIVTWNVARFIELKQNNNKGSQTRLKMMDLLKQQNADVLCLQEFHTSIDPHYYNNIEYIRNELKYPYYYFTYEVDSKDHYYSSIIFSRLPIIDTGKMYYPRPGIREVLLHADLKFQGDTVRVYTTHLQSVLFAKSDYDKIDQIQHGDEGMIRNSKSIFSKWKLAAGIRGSQANTVRDELDRSPFPVIFTGDLNDVPTSYTYAAVRGNRRDAFLEKGFGMGRTFSAISPTLRIDYIFTDKKYSVRRLKKYVRNLSDHYMMVADLKLNELQN